jgi:glyoxylase I family protein
MKSLEHAAIVADDPEALANWYCTTLGFELIAKGELVLGGKEITYRFLGLSGGALLEILPSNKKPRSSKDPDDAGIRHLAFLVDDFEDSCQFLREKGLDLGAERELPDGTKLVFFPDPEGNLLQLVYRAETLRSWL